MIVFLIDKKEESFNMSTEIEKLKKKIEQLKNELGERNKELTLLYGFSQAIEDINKTKEEIAMDIVKLIPPAWQWPEFTCANIMLYDKKYKSENFKESNWKQSSNILVGDEKIGSIDVYYSKEMPEHDEGPFLKEERLLIDSIAERLGNYFDRVDKNEINQIQAETLLELSSPIITIWEGILAIPIIGTLDSSRSQMIMETILNRIVEMGSRVAIFDLTGVNVVDSQVANHLIKTLTAIELIGAIAIITGIRPEIAQTIVNLGISLKGIITRSTLAEGLEYAFNQLNIKID